MDAGASHATRLAEFYVRSSLLEDERVRSVRSCMAQSRGDALLVVATVIAVSGVTAHSLDRPSVPGAIFQSE